MPSYNLISVPDSVDIERSKRAPNNEHLVLPPTSPIKTIQASPCDRGGTIAFPGTRAQHRFHRCRCWVTSAILTRIMCETLENARSAADWFDPASPVNARKSIVMPICPLSLILPPPTRARSLARRASDHAYRQSGDSSARPSKMSERAATCSSTCDATREAVVAVCR